MQEADIVERILSGEQELFAELVHSHQTLVFRTCLGFTHNKEDAEDLTQEVFINAYQQLYRFKGDAKLSTWFYRIAVNLSLNHIRSSKKRNLFQRIEDFFAKDKAISASSSLHVYESPEHLYITKQENEAIQKAIDSLPEKQRVAFTLSRYDELPQSTIAEIMSTSEGAVEQLLQRAKTSLRKKLEPFYKK